MCARVDAREMLRVQVGGAHRVERRASRRSAPRELRRAPCSRANGDDRPSRRRRSARCRASWQRSSGVHRVKRDVERGVRGGEATGAVRRISGERRAPARRTLGTRCRRIAARRRCGPPRRGSARAVRRSTRSPRHDAPTCSPGRGAARRARHDLGRFGRLMLLVLVAAPVAVPADVDVARSAEPVADRQMRSAKRLERRLCRPRRPNESRRVRAVTACARRCARRRARRRAASIAIASAAKPVT